MLVRFGGLGARENLGQKYMQSTLGPLCFDIPGCTSTTMQEIGNRNESSRLGLNGTGANGFTLKNP